MEENTNWKPNELGGASAANNSNDWRSHLDSGFRKSVLSKLVNKLKEHFPLKREDMIREVASKVEEKAYNTAIDKAEYVRKLAGKMHAIEHLHKTGQLGSSVPRANTSGPAMNQVQPTPTSLPYTQTPTIQNWLPQNAQSNLNIPGSSHLPTQVPIATSMVQNINREMQGRQQHRPQQQQMNQHLLKEKVGHGNMQPQQMQQPQQQQYHPQSLLKKQPVQQSLTQLSSDQQNSQMLPRYQFQTQPVRSSPQQQMVQPSQEHSPLMNVPNTQQNHPTQRQHMVEQRAFRVSSSPQNNIASFQERPQRQHQSGNFKAAGSSLLATQGHQEVGKSQPIMSQQYRPAASVVVPSQRQHQPSNFNTPGSSFLATPVQEVGQSQPMMSQHYRPNMQQQKTQKRSSQQYLDSSQMFQAAASSLNQTQNIANQQIHPNQSQRAPLANPSTSQDSVNATGDWQEETYQKIKAMKEKYLPILITIHSKIMQKLRQIESLPPEKMGDEPIPKIKAFKSSIEHVMVFLNVTKNSVTEKHRDKFDLYEEHILKLTKNHTIIRKSMQQQQQGQFTTQSAQVNMSQSLEKDQMKSQLMSSNQIGASPSVSGPRLTSQTALLQTRQKLEPRDESKIVASSGNVMLHSKTNPVQSSMFLPRQQKQTHHRQTQQPQSRRQQQQQQQPQQENQKLQIPSSHEMNDVRMSQGVNIKTELLQQHVSLSQHQLTKGISNVSPSAQIQYNSSPQLVDKTKASSKSCGSPFVSQSAIPGDSENPISVESPVSHAESLDCSVKLGTHDEPPFKILPEQPIDRLIRAFKTRSPRSLEQSVNEMGSIMGMVDRMAGSFHPDGGSRAGLGEDLSFETRNFTTDEQEEYPSKRFKRLISADPQDMAPETDWYNQFSSLESEFDFAVASGPKANENEPGSALLQEIKEINRRLIETVVEICDEDTLGTIVTCSYVPVALSAQFKDHYNSGKISQIQPLRLLVLGDYPYSSPIILEEFSLDTSVHSYEDLSARTRSRFSFSLKELSDPNPISLEDIAQMWNDSSRATMIEYAERHGGGTFSSKYGAWETVLRAS
ncbi:hypothetical protein CARUB_v10019419mg [Capsella rubella]|uniref:Mediator complex subunit 15 KIX domain-containing protein n=1 Tax=Capsella rubella TaxID=81985 RepID=R0HLC5_9BRAS|nr:probable mediator of RNA polymerase II transcription subunit 15c isoform X2 [Capsella rubella]EOA26015.1 hypothetical protein CARUB_v10019419mg [Capsella rubella]